MGRFAVKILAAVALIWGAWWYIATGSLQNSVTAWLDDRRNEGWQADTGTVARAGFPMRIATVIETLTLNDPATRAVLLVPEITLSTPIYWPGHATVKMPAQSVTITVLQKVLTLTTAGAEAALRLHPGSTLQLEQVRGSSSDLTLDAAEGQLFGAKSLTTSVQQGLLEQTYDIDIVVAEFAPGSLIREVLRLPNSWPTAFEALQAEAIVTFDRPWDRTALAGNRPQPRAIEIRQAEAIWADLRVSLGARLDVAEGGILSGTVNIQADNWQRMLDLAITGGTLSSEMRPQIESGIALLAGLSGSSDSLDLDITLENGRMRMGFIPLGAAPRLIYH